MHLRLDEIWRLNSWLRAPRPPWAPIVRSGGTCAHLLNWARRPNDLALLDEPNARAAVFRHRWSSRDNDLDLR